MALRAASLVVCQFVASCGGGTFGEKPNRPEGVVIELSGGKNEPTGVLTYKGDSQEGVLGTHCWTSQCVDFAAPPPAASFTETRPNVEVMFKGEGKPESLMVGIPQAQPLDQTTGLLEIQIRHERAYLELTTGRHVLVVFALWDQGDAVLTFGLEVPA